MRESQKDGNHTVYQLYSLYLGTIQIEFNLQKALRH